ncbi:MAG: hypothetical protein Q9214_006811 [Letrouitia sp. 1 TL-2023]
MATNAELPVFLSNDPLVNPQVTEALADHNVSQEARATQSLMTNEPLKTDENLRDTDAFKRTSIVTERMVAPSEPTSSSDVVSPMRELKEILQDSLQFTKSGILSTVDLLPGASKLKRALEETDELIVCPGVHDGFSARIALDVGFTALYMTGAGTTASRLGMADLGVAQLHDMREHAEMIANLDPQGPPLIADMDTGYGGPIMVANSVQQYIRAGVAGFHIEDQIQNKRCGHLQGKRVVEMETFLSRIRAAKAAKDSLHSDIVLIARTDANQQHGYDECIKRLKAARELGADVGLLEGFKSKEEARQAVQELAPWPLLLNSVENGSSPLISASEAKEMGFRIMIFSFATLAPMYSAVRSGLEVLKRDGVLGTRKELTPKKLFEVCGLEESMDLDVKAGGSNFVGGV